jgi:threonine aldolase
MGRVVDLRTDLDTQPPPEMRKAMYEAPMGLDLVGEDTMTNQLEAKTAEMLGKEAGLFISTGVMADLIPVLTCCDRGDMVILGDRCHIITSECGGISALGGTFIYTVPNDKWGMMNPAEIESALHLARSTITGHSPYPKLVCIENTHVRCSGTVLTIEDQRRIAEVAHRYSVPVWCDGARFINAAVYLGISLAELAKDLDSVSFGYMKTLGAYTGAVLCGSADFIKRARRIRYMLGGQIPMSGFIAAGCIWALEHLVDRIAEDHTNARFLAEALANMRGVTIDLETIQTNIVMFHVPRIAAGEFVAKLKKNGVLCWPFQDQVRAVTDFTISRSDIEFAIDAINRALKE